LLSLPTIHPEQPNLRPEDTLSVSFSISVLASCQHLKITTTPLSSKYATQ